MHAVIQMVLGTMELELQVLLLRRSFHLPLNCVTAKQKTLAAMSCRL